VFNLTLHNNFTPDGLKYAAFPAGLIPDKSLNGVPEWAYGVTDWFEAGLYCELRAQKKSGWIFLSRPLFIPRQKCEGVRLARTR